MKYVLERMIWNKDLYIPFIIIFVIWIIAESRRKYRDDDTKGRMLKAGILLFPFSLLWCIVFVVVRSIIGNVFSYDTASGILGISAGIIINALFAAAIHSFLNSECLGKIKRIISIIVLFILCTAELIIFVEILSGCTT